MPRPDTIPPVRAASLATQVHNALTEMLLSGELRPDDRLSMRDLADRLGVSVMPVRDAVARLVAQQALVVLPNRAVAVPLLTRAEFRDLTEVRIHNETHAAALAATRASLVEIASLRRADAAFEAALTAPNAKPAVAANKTLHFIVYDAAGSPALSGVIRALWLKAGPIINLDLEERARRRRTAASRAWHAQLLAAIEARDGAAAADAVEADIRAASEFILSRDILPARPLSQGSRPWT